MAAWNYIKSKKSFTSHSRRSGVYWQRKGPFPASNGPALEAMKLGFLRKPAREESPLVVSMTGVRLGDRVDLRRLEPGAADAARRAHGAVGPGAGHRRRRRGSEGARRARWPPCRSGRRCRPRTAPTTWPSWRPRATGPRMLAPLFAAVRAGGRIVVVIGARAQGPLAFLKSSGSREPEPALVVDRSDAPDGTARGASADATGWSSSRRVPTLPRWAGLKSAPLASSRTVPSSRGQSPSGDRRQGRCTPPRLAAPANRSQAQ